MGWAFLALGFVGATTMALWAAMAAQAVPGGDPAMGRLVAWVGAVYTLPTWTYLLTVLVVRFPEGLPTTPAEHRLLRWAAVTAVVLAVAAGLRPGPLLVYPAYDNPVTLPEAVRGVVSIGSVIGVGIAIVPMALAVGRKIRRYRALESIERLQLRWFAYAAAITLTTGLLYIVVGVFLAPNQTALREATFALFVGTASSLPIAVLVAISRYHLYDIDRIISRTVAYGALTAILAGLYAASVRLFNAIFVLFTGEGSEAALVLTTLVLATTFTPIKSRLERIAARRFPPEPSVGIDQAAAAQGSDGPVTANSTQIDADLADLDGRIETIARRVAREVVAEGRPDAPGR
jgi:hypothetical protein